MKALTEKVRILTVAFLAAVVLFCIFLYLPLPSPPSSRTQERSLPGAPASDRRVEVTSLPRREVVLVKPVQTERETSEAKRATEPHKVVPVKPVRAEEENSEAKRPTEPQKVAPVELVHPEERKPEVNHSTEPRQGAPVELVQPPPATSAELRSVTDATEPAEKPPAVESPHDATDGPAPMLAREEKELRTRGETLNQAMQALEDLLAQASDEKSALSAVDSLREDSSIRGDLVTGLESLFDTESPAAGVTSSGVKELTDDVERLPSDGPAGEASVGEAPAHRAYSIAVSPAKEPGDPFIDQLVSWFDRSGEPRAASAAEPRPRRSETAPPTPPTPPTPNEVAPEIPAALTQHPLPSTPPQTMEEWRERRQQYRALARHEDSAEVSAVFRLEPQDPDKFQAVMAQYRIDILLEVPSQGVYTIIPGGGDYWDKAEYRDGGAYLGARYGLSVRNLRFPWLQELRERHVATKLISADSVEVALLIPKSETEVLLGRIVAGCRALGHGLEEVSACYGTFVERSLAGERLFEYEVTRLILKDRTLTQ